MNERIRDLFEQACFETEYDDNQNLPDMIERFAELIVRECAEVCERLGAIPYSGVEYEYAECSKEIRNNFGVE